VKQIYPIKHLSLSSIRLFLSDRQMFHKRYIRKEYDMMGNPAMLEGSLFHEVMEGHNLGMDYKAIFDNTCYRFDEEGRFDNVDWGKTGSKEGSIKKVQKVLDMYFANEPESLGEIECVEQSYTAHIEDLESRQLPIPIKGVIDVVYNNRIIEDYKLVSKLHEQDEVVPGFILQATTYYLLYEAIKGYPPKKIVFTQVKKSANADKSSQIKRYDVKVTDDMINQFVFIYDAILEELKSFKPLPNIFDMMGGTDSYLDFIKQLKETREGKDGNN